MKSKPQTSQPEHTEEQPSLADRLRESAETCKTCSSMTPAACLSDCRVWKLKNELRRLREKLNSPAFTEKLLNVLKNNRRIETLHMLSKRRHSIDRLQQELGKSGYCHSQTTIVREYVKPLLDAGLADEGQGRYYATIFGCRVSESIQNSGRLADLLPSHSGCYEEQVLNTLLEQPRTFEDLGSLIQTRSLARVLGRLVKAGLVETVKEKDYVFYFRSKRHPGNESFSPTERRVYESIPPEGISAGRLAQKAGISLRRTYKYLRKLRGRKMIFDRRIPKTYALGPGGVRVAKLLRELNELVAEGLEATELLLEEEGMHEPVKREVSRTMGTKRPQEITALAMMRPVRES